MTRWTDVARAAKRTVVESDISYPLILAWAAPVFVALIALEWRLVARGTARGRYGRCDAFTSLALGTGNLVSDILMGAISLAALMWVWQFRLFDLGTSLPTVIGAFIAGDLLYYWKHRWAHRVRWLWSAHVVHHSSQHYNLATALRQPWNNHITGYALLSSPLILLGVHPVLLGFVMAINLVYQFWIHTEAIDKLPRWVEAVFNTPSHHRVHHGIQPQYLDRNYAGVFIIWDRLFGTFEPEGETPVYGTVKPYETFNPVVVAFQELIQIGRDVTRPGLTLGERLRYLLAPPGYSHDGSRQTSEQMRAMRRGPTSRYLKTEDAA